MWIWGKEKKNQENSQKHFISVEFPLNRVYLSYKMGEFFACFANLEPVKMPDARPVKEKYVAYYTKFKDMQIYLKVMQKKF